VAIIFVHKLLESLCSVSGVPPRAQELLRIDPGTVGLHIHVGRAARCGPKAASAPRPAACLSTRDVHSPCACGPATTYSLQRRATGDALVDAPSLLGVNQSRKNVAKQSATYSELHAEDAPTEVRVSRAQEMVNQYYDLATDFYE
jgi:hypothetical protein